MENRTQRRRKVLKVIASSIATGASVTVFGGNSAAYSNGGKQRAAPAEHINMVRAEVMMSIDNYLERKETINQDKENRGGK
jgi:hypothetical protein